MSHTALVMAGGSSERMRAGGCRTHKALRTINGISLLEWNLRNLFSFAFTDVSIAVNEAEDQLISAIDGLASLARAHGATLNTVRERVPLGTMGAARLMIERAENILVINVDNLTDLDLREFFNFHIYSRAALTVASHREPFRIPFGELKAENSRVTAYIEKPAFPILVSSGTYVLHRRAMSAISTAEKTQAPDLINALISAGELVSTFEHNAWWIDVNDEAALAGAEASLANKALKDNQKLAAAACA